MPLNTCLQLVLQILLLLVVASLFPTSLATSSSPTTNNVFTTNNNNNNMVEVDPAGINDGSGAACQTHDFSFLDENHLAEQRVASLTKILVEKYGVDSEHLVKAICALGEGRLVILLFCCGWRAHFFFNYKARVNLDSLTDICIL